MALKDTLEQLLKGSSYQSKDVLSDKTKMLARRANVGAINAPRLQRNVQNLPQQQRVRITNPTPQAQPIMQRVQASTDRINPALRIGEKLQPTAQKIATPVRSYFRGDVARFLGNPEKVEAAKQKVIAKLPERGRKITEPLFRAGAELLASQSSARDVGLLERDLGVKFDPFGRATVLDETLSPSEKINRKKEAEKKYRRSLAMSMDLAGEGDILEQGSKAAKKFAKTGVKAQGDVFAQIEPTTRTAQKIKGRIVTAQEKSAKQGFQEWQKQVYKQEGVTTQGKLIDSISKQIKTSTKSPVVKDISNVKDIGTGAVGMRDMYRNFERAFRDAPESYKALKSQYLDPLDTAKGSFSDEIIGMSSELEKKIVKDLGIKKGSKSSELVQLYGEKQISLDELKKRAPKDWQKIVKADEWFRLKYNDMLQEINAIRARIYPNDPSKIVPTRQDYYRHFRELDQGVGALLNIFDTPGNIDPKLAAISEFTKPKTKWQSAFQQRLGNKTDVDAVGGFLNYITTYAHAKHIDPETAKLRMLQQELENAVEVAKNNPDVPNVENNLNNLLIATKEWIDDMQGKTSSIDRLVTKYVPGGRQTLSVLNWVNSRVKANTVAMNFSSSVSQIFNVPQGIGSAKKYSGPGLVDTLAEIAGKKVTPIDQSNFIKERYLDSAIPNFDEGMLNDIKRFSRWLLTVGDEAGTKFIWNSHYRKAVAEGIENPVKYADDITRKLVAGRGIGEVPLLQKSKLFQLAAPFQLEVTNSWYVMREFVDKKDFGGLMAMLFAGYVMNKGAEQVRGSDVVFDPINAIMEAYSVFDKEENKARGAVLAAGRLGGEVLSNVPFGQTVAAMYPEYGFGNNPVTREQLFGDADPTRYGSGLLVSKGIQDPVYKLVPPLGGSQIKRTIEGVKTVSQGYAESNKGKVQYPVEQGPRNFIQAFLFGKYSLPEAREYFNEDRSVMGDKQSAVFKSLGADEKKAYYDLVDLKRKVNKVKSDYKAGKISEGKATKMLSDLNKQYVHFMPNGQMMEGIEHKDALPASTIAKSNIRRTRVRKPSAPKTPKLKSVKLSSKKAEPKAVVYRVKDKNKVRIPV